MENQVNYNIMPSLKHMAFRTITATMWNQKDIKQLATEFCFQSMNGKTKNQLWHTVVEDTVKQNVRKLYMPESLISEVIKLVKPIGLEISKWIKFHISFLDDAQFVILILDKLSCTSLGTVNYKKTAEFIVRDEQLDLVKRYKLACVYCLESDIPALWEQLPRSDKRRFYCKDNPSKHIQHELVLIWTYFIKGEANKLNRRINLLLEDCSFNEYAFKYAAHSGNRVATEHFFQKLTTKERKGCLVETTQCVAKTRCDLDYGCTHDFPKECYCDVLAYLLLQCNEADQVKVFQKYPYRVLKCFISWPWQDHFIQIAERMWPFLPEFDYNTLLRILTENINIFGYNYHKIIRKFWLQSPISFKEYVINKQCNSGGYLSTLFKENDQESIKFFLGNVTTVDRERMISSHSGLHICHNLMLRNRWDLLEMFVQECMLSEEAVTKLQVAFQRFLSRIYPENQIQLKRHKWEDFMCYFMAVI
ncbi:uncharacterized protein CEXT_646871 [Caerostris extrusa]|uniref:Uncharacterized protein n=1 Tax=Caerostris extrusa TaxID=172846 RepID=A0AAV4XX54_CAEEX|nr:uncharacterized protein CEXT_646871 [Caerostris extrusa]